MEITSNDIPKKPQPIQPLLKASARGLWQTFGNSLLNGKEPYVIDELAEKYISYFTNETQKGLAVVGNKGIGKSLNFLIYQRIRSTIKGESMNIRVLEVKEIEHFFKLEGQPFIDELINVKELVINDVGTDSSVIKHYGSNIELVNEILTLRYIKWQKLGGAFKTHISSNLVEGQIEKMYGDRIYDRFKEMFNTIVSDNLISYRK
ncbi:MAG: DNA replication protein [Bacteriophage sp.]|nr:MAG: DNA replication protein [Bacteriophage sp.]